MRDFLVKGRKGEYSELGLLEHKIFSGSPSPAQSPSSASVHPLVFHGAFYEAGSPRLTIEAAYYLLEAHNVLQRVTALRQAPKLYLDKE